jgi:hypothetical protein
MSNSHLQTLMMIAGIGLMCWVMLRGRLKSKRRSNEPWTVPSLKHNGNANLGASQFTGTSSVGAPADVLKWQVEFYELARQLKAELDSKMVAVRQLSLDFDRAANRLEHLIQAADLSGIPVGQKDQIVQHLGQAGWTQGQIAATVETK